MCYTFSLSYYDFRKIRKRNEWSMDFTKQTLCFRHNCIPHYNTHQIQVTIKVVFTQRYSRCLHIFHDDVWSKIWDSGKIFPNLEMITSAHENDLLHPSMLTKDRNGEPTIHKKTINMMYNLLYSVLTLGDIHIFAFKYRNGALKHLAFYYEFGKTCLPILECKRQ